MYTIQQIVHVSTHVHVKHKEVSMKLFSTCKKSDLY